MDPLGESFTFRVPFVVGGVPWSVQVDKTTVGNKSMLTVVEAERPDGQVVSGLEWEKHITLVGLSEAFWATAVQTLLNLIRGVARPG